MARIAGVGCLHNRVAAQDAAQEVFMGLVRNMPGWGSALS